MKPETEYSPSRVGESAPNCEHLSAWRACGLKCEACARSAGEPPTALPVAWLTVQMDRDDMGQSLAPNPPYKVAIANATELAKTLPLGKYALYLNAQAEQRAGESAQGVCVDKDPRGCWNVRCQLGKKCVRS